MSDETKFLGQRIADLVVQVKDAETVIDALLGVVLGHAEREAFDACQQLVGNYQEKWGNDRSAATQGPPTANKENRNG